ncbi:MAG: hypothetical protein ABIL68_01710, partial [bacterium]
MMKKKIVFMFFILFGIVLFLCCASDKDKQESIIFATFAESGEQLKSIQCMAESIRTFAGKHRLAPIWVYIPDGVMEEESEALEALCALDVEVKTSHSPEDATWFYFARKVFASARAEAEAVGRTAVLAWIDDDTIVLREPDEFILPKGKSMGYRPVMHRNIGSLYSEPADAFWSRAYEKMSVSESSLFPMATVADGDTIRPYFNAGCMVVRPERGILRKWADYFPML